VHAQVDQDHWKRKYFDALRSLEQEERGFRSLETLLRRIITRLCLGVLGRSEELDAHVRRLSDATRRRAEEHELEALFGPLSQAIAALDAREAPPPSPAPAPAAACSAPDAPGSGTVIPDDGRVRAVLSRVLSELRRDPALAQRCRDLDTRLERPLCPVDLATLLAAVVDLTVERIGGIEQQKAEIEGLLAQVSERLDEMTRYISGEDQDRKLALESTQELNTRLMREMSELDSSLQSTVDVVQLKSRLRLRLDAIGGHLQDFRAREEDRVRQQWERSEKMRQRLERLERESREMQERLRNEQRLSLLDALTQIPNRLAYDQRIEEEFARLQRFRQPLCVAAWDIDHFKQINDAYGHRAGDKVLRIVAACLSERLRETDFLARYGGEEFVMILPGCDGPAALQLAEEMRAAVGSLGFHFRGNPVGVTVSCGLTMADQDSTPDEVFERADRALYRAKEAGRNRCELA
jgi:diguanylate cyclase